MAKKKPTEPWRDVLERLRTAIHEQCRNLPAESYRRVMESLQADIHGHLDALDEEEDD